MLFALLVLIASKNAETFDDSISALCSLSEGSISFKWYFDSKFGDMACSWDAAVPGRLLNFDFEIWKVAVKYVDMTCWLMFVENVLGDGPAVYHC